MSRMLGIVGLGLFLAWGGVTGRGWGALHAGEPIKIGVIVPTSGQLAPYGKNTLDGMKLRMEEANKAGGVNGRLIELVVEDNKGDKTESRNAYRKLVGTDRVVAVMGPVTSTNTKALKRDAKTMKVPVISPTATNDQVTANNEYMFRSCFRDSFQGAVVAQYAFKELGLRKAAVLIDQNSDYSKGLTHSFKRAFKALGGIIVASEGYRQKDTEFGAQLNKVKASGAELLFVPGYPPEVPLIIKQAKVVGYSGRGKICGADGWDNQAIINGSGDFIAGCFLTGMFSPDDKREIVQSFIKKYRERSGRKPGTFEAQGYDTAALILEALKKGADAESVRQGLLGIKGYEAVTGSITIMANGDAAKSAVILGVVKQGDTYTTQYKATVSP